MFGSTPQFNIASTISMGESSNQDVIRYAATNSAVTESGLSYNTIAIDDDNRACWIAFALWNEQFDVIDLPGRTAHKPMP